MAQCAPAYFQLADRSGVDIAHSTEGHLRWQRLDGTSALLSKRSDGKWSSSLGLAATTERSLISLFGWTTRDLVLFVTPYLVWLCIGLLLWAGLRRRIRNKLARALTFSVLFAPTLCPVLREAAVLAPAWICGFGICVFAFDPFLHNPKGAYLTDVLEFGILPISLLGAIYLWANRGKKRDK